MILFLNKDLANLFCHRKFANRLTLTNSFSIVTYGVVFIIQIKAEHLASVFRSAHWLWSNA